MNKLNKLRTAQVDTPLKPEQIMPGTVIDKILKLLSAKKTLKGDPFYAQKRTLLFNRKQRKRPSGELKNLFKKCHTIRKTRSGRLFGLVEICMR